MVIPVKPDGSAYMRTRCVWEVCVRACVCVCVCVRAGVVYLFLNALSAAPGLRRTIGCTVSARPAAAWKPMGTSHDLDR